MNIADRYGSFYDFSNDADIAAFERRFSQWDRAMLARKERADVAAAEWAKYVAEYGERSEVIGDAEDNASHLCREIYGTRRGFRIESQHRPEWFDWACASADSLINLYPNP